MTKLSRLRAEFAGRLVEPGDPEYDEARAVWNSMHDRKPSLIARCATAEDVSAALRHARTTGRAVTVRGGGHNVAGTAVADDAVMVDLSLMREVRVDPNAGVAHAQGGCLLRDLDAATLAHGLVCPSGVVSHTGLGGLALGGGYGWLHRKWGLTCDHLLAAEVVLADGTIVEASADLLWGLRGGGGNLGVVTRFTLRLREVSAVHLHTGVFAPDDAVAALAAYRDFAEAQSRDLHTVGAFKHAGRQDWIPAALRGTPAMFLTAAWFGDPADGPARTTPLFVDAAGNSARVLPFAELQALGDHSEPHGNRYYTKSCYLTRLSGGPDARLVECATEMPSPLSAIDFEFLGGAITDVPDADSAFPRRDAPYMCTVSAQWTDPARDSENAAWSRRGVERLAEWHYGGAYVNYLQDEQPGKVAEVYGAGRYERLAVLKSRYDPANQLAGNQNIPPLPERKP
ncbi:FAD-binding oxidoreductase [Actinocrispum wychmicini]|uniref:FAD/FMN-containing dehydrogenase n=1 Tax=Actinocrispum wychmicini TaxID=1213861 RepID=A0A4R2JNJ4_9PSEU|nr:FAD-binding oxidoreductase [Actinocrispum wychmicini]TCO55755.1 FAD/FMN-containing dehydrogenase [Actinocrispum wychmicini]